MASTYNSELFENFCSAKTFQDCLGTFEKLRQGLEPGPITEFYQALKLKLTSWKAKSLWDILDAKAGNKIYKCGEICASTRVLVVGAGPCGLRIAIELQLLGAKVVLIEKRDTFSRNNVLTLWPFVITDLKALGSTLFKGQLPGNSMVHIPIQQLQCMLLKVALVLGVEVHGNLTFVQTIEPSLTGVGWRAEVHSRSDVNHKVSVFEFNVLIGAEGRQKTIDGFNRLEFRGRFAIAITVNFINGKTSEENRVPEIRTGEQVYRHLLFDKLRHQANIDLENILYYKDETHYFVMTAKRQNLLDHGVLVDNLVDHAELLAPNNVNVEQLQRYARTAAEQATGLALKGLPFAKNGAGKPDVAIFDFTTMFGAENACRATVQRGHALLVCLVGDALLNPFWPTGSGCARGFLSCLDAANAVRQYADPRNSLLGIIAQRESVYRRLAQTTATNLQADMNAYTMDPSTRYRNLNKSAVEPDEVKHLLAADDPELYEATALNVDELQSTPRPITMRQRRSLDDETLGQDSLIWIKHRLHYVGFVQELTKASECFTDGRVLINLIHRFHPGLIDLNATRNWTKEECNETAFHILEKDFCIPRVMTAKSSILLVNVPSHVWATYLDEICDAFRSRAPNMSLHKRQAADRFREMYEQRKNLTNSYQNLRIFFEDISMGSSLPQRSLSYAKNSTRKLQEEAHSHPVSTVSKGKL